MSNIAEEKKEEVKKNYQFIAPRRLGKRGALAIFEQVLNRCGFYFDPGTGMWQQQPPITTAKRIERSTDDIEIITTASSKKKKQKQISRHSDNYTE